MDKERMEIKIKVKNIEEFQKLVERAKKESGQLKKTIEQIHNFKFEIN